MYFFNFEITIWDMRYVKHIFCKWIQNPNWQGKYYFFLYISYLQTLTDIKKCIQDVSDSRKSERIWIITPKWGWIKENLYYRGCLNHCLYGLRNTLFSDIFQLKYWYWITRYSVFISLFLVKLCLYCLARFPNSLFPAPLME